MDGKWKGANGMRGRGKVIKVVRERERERERERYITKRVFERWKAVWKNEE